jgi:hypothetical protein
MHYVRPIEVLEPNLSERRTESIEETNGSILPDTKITSGHVKKTSKGYTYVNPTLRTNKWI